MGGAPGRYPPDDGRDKVGLDPGGVAQPSIVPSQRASPPPRVIRRLSSSGSGRNSRAAAPMPPMTTAIGEMSGIAAPMARFTASTAPAPSQLFPQEVRRRPHRRPTTAPAASPRAL